MLVIDDKISFSTAETVSNLPPKPVYGEIHSLFEKEHRRGGCDALNPPKAPPHILSASSIIG